MAVSCGKRGIASIPDSVRCNRKAVSPLRSATALQMDGAVPNLECGGRGEVRAGDTAFRLALNRACAEAIGKR